MSFDPSGGDQRYAVEQEGGGLPEFLLDPIGVAQRRRIPMAASSAAGLLATLVAVIFWKAMYVATATILLTSQQIPKAFVQPTVESDSLTDINAMVGEVLSADRLSKLIETHKLFSETAERSPRMDLVKQMRRRITAAPQMRPGGGGGSQSIVYEISYESRDPEEAATVSNAVAALFVEVSVERRNTQAHRATVFLRNALERTEKDLREQSSKVSEFRQAHRGELPDEQETSMRRLELLSTRRESLSQQITAKEDRLLSISSHGSDTSEGEVLVGELRRQLAREIAIHTDEHPNVIALRDRLARLEEANRKNPLPAATSRMIEDERREVTRLREERDRIDAELAELNQRVERTPRIAEGLAALQQRETVLREDYTTAMHKVEQAELAENLESARQGGQVSILDAAARPSSPERPRWLVLLAGMGMSIAFAVGVGVLLELIDPVVVAANQIEKLSDRPVLGSVPLVG